MTRRIGNGLLVLGVSAAGVAVAGEGVPFLPIGHSHTSLFTYHGICSSGMLPGLGPLGPLGQAVSGQQLQLNCTPVTVGYWGAILTGIAGLALIVVGIIRISAERAQRPPSWPT